MRPVPPSTEYETFWSTPQLPSRLFTFWRREYDVRQDKMTTNIINDGNTTGLSFCWDREGVSSLHVHKRNQTPTMHYDPVSRALWVYIPLARGEWIREIWLRYKGREPNVSLIVRT